MSEFTQRVSQLVEIPSTADNPAALRAALEFVAAPIETIPNTTIERFAVGDAPGLLAYAGNKRPDKFSVLLSGHLDVVPGRPDQFTVRYEDNKMYGRGPADMKATALGHTVVFCEMAQEIEGLGILLTTDEEDHVGVPNGAQLAAQQGVDADLVIVGECTDPREVRTECKGVARVRAGFVGLRAHEAYESRGRNALEEAAEYVVGMKAIYPKTDKWRTSAVTTVMGTTNLTHNLVPDDGSVFTSFRYVPGDSNFANPESLREFLQPLARPDTTFEITAFDPAVKVDANQPLVQSLLRAIEVVHGQPARVGRANGTSDGRFFRNAVAFGMNGGGIHSDQEYLELNSIEPYIQTLRHFLGGLSLSLT
jgi:succinyl-diaminopimelate desuccinylase